MASLLLPQFLVGTTFGSALLLSGVSDPKTIISQFQLQDFHMLVSFLSASALSALVVYISNASGYAKLPARSSSDYGWLGRYGGNVVGGLMQGVAMAVSGACPGTVLVQTVMGWGKGAYVMAGGVLGGGLFLLYGDKLKVRRRSNGRRGGRAKSRSPKRMVSRETTEIKTFQEKLDLTTEQMVFVYEVMMAGVIACASLYAPMDTPWRKALLGGVMIGLAQASSVLFSKKTLGVSTAFQDVAGHAIGLANRSATRPGWGSIMFASGVMTGAKLVSQYTSIKKSSPGIVDVSAGAAFVAGAISIFGARLAGGCTSGHGISGCSTLSISSLITVASMFGGGIAFKMLV